jgi:hypothetical protein
MIFWYSGGVPLEENETLIFRGKMILINTMEEG